MHRHLALAAVAMAALFAIGSAQAELVTNGGFETGDMSGWTASDADARNTYSGTGGSWYAYMAQRSGGSFEQTLATVAGTTYTLSFDWTNFAPYGANAASLDVDLIGSLGTLLDLTLTETAFTGFSVPASAYTHYTRTFVADGASTVLRFSTGVSSYWDGILVDQVSVIAAGGASPAVPLPGTAWLVGAALLAAGLTRRRSGR
jgi:hypothetical protein